MVESRFQRALAEGIGVFGLVFVGVLAVSAGTLIGDPEAVSLTTVAFAHGLIIAVMVAAVSAISGGHINPAVTLGFVATGRMDVATGAVYWLGQFIGAVLAAALIGAVFGGLPVAEGTPALAPGVGTGAGIVLEAVGTFFLVFVIFGTAVDERAPRAVFPLAIGLTVALDIMAIGLLTGGAVNPARAFGPALVSGSWANQLVYWIGPLLGGALGAIVYNATLMERAPTEEIAERGGPVPRSERGERGGRAAD